MSLLQNMASGLKRAVGKYGLSSSISFSSSALLHLTLGLPPFNLLSSHDVQRGKQHSQVDEAKIKRDGQRLEAPQAGSIQQVTQQTQTIKAQLSEHRELVEPTVVP